jgi:hypothetical protein
MEVQKNKSVNDQENDDGKKCLDVTQDDKYVSYQKSRCIKYL